MIALQYVHPILVHFPIVFFVSLAALDTILGLRGIGVTGRNAIGNISTGLALLAGGFALATYIFGDIALEIAEAGGFHNDIAEMHEHLGTLTMALFLAWALVRGVIWLKRIKLTGFTAVLLPVLEIAGAALVITTAYYGGELVYGLGVNVAKTAIGG